MRKPLAVPKTTPQIEFYPAGDGRRLAARLWSCCDATRAHVVFLHGITSHGGWYHRSCAHLAAAGFCVHFLDRRGSGLNPEDRGDVDRWQTWVEDVRIYLQTLHGTAPVVLCGISWGGKLATAVARRDPGLVHALALLCPGLFSPHEPGLAKRVALTALACARLQRRRVSIPLRRAELFTDTPPWREFIARDPLTLREVTWRFARHDRRLTRYARHAAPFLHMPLLLTLAGRDRIVNNRRTRCFFIRTRSPKRTLLEYPGAAHTLEFEPDPMPYFQDLTDWISAVTLPHPLHDPKAARPSTIAAAQHDDHLRQAAYHRAGKMPAEHAE